MSDQDLPREVARAKWIDGLSWSEITDKFKGGRETLRSAARRYKAEHPDEFTREAPVVTESVGVTADRQALDPEAVYQRACQAWKQTSTLMEIRTKQALVFDHGPVCLVESADWHLGDQGVDYPRLKRELEIIADTPGMFLITAGDLLNQFIIGKLKDARYGSPLSIPDEWALAKFFLSIPRKKHLLSISGNHDNWLELLVGVSYFREVLKDINPKVIYDADEALVDVTVGDWTVPVKVRHKWRGTSIYNPTHGIERAAKWDQDFLIGMGAHTHASGITRGFNDAGVTGMAMMAGAYKRVDPYARREGFAKPNQSTAVSVVIDPRHRSLTGFDNLEAAADYMDAIYE